MTRGDFTIDDEGELSFIQRPNYESPGRCGHEQRVTMVTVQAADPSRNRGEKEIEVRVTNMERSWLCGFVFGSGACGSAK